MTYQDWLIGNTAFYAIMLVINFWLGINLCQYASNHRVAMRNNGMVAGMSNESLIAREQLLQQQKMQARSNQAANSMYWLIISVHEQ